MIFQGVHMKVMLLCMLMCVAGALSADNIQPGDDVSEFFFSEIEGRKAGPNAFLRDHALQQAWPAHVDNAFRAEAARKARGAFDQVRYRGKSRGQSGVWRLVGPMTESTEGSYGNSTGRVTDLAIGPSCNDDQCRMFVGTAGGGLWRTDRALHPDNPGWRHLGNGLEVNTIGAVTLDPNDASGNTLYVGTGETNFNYSSGAGLGLYKSTDGGDRFIRIPTMITDPVVSPDPIDFAVTRGISQVVVVPGSPETLYIATTTALIGMTAVRGGQSTITGGAQGRVGLYRTTDGGASWTLLFDVPINEYSSPDTPDGIYEQISGVKDVQLDPQDAETIYISVADDGLYRSSPALEGGDASFHKLFQLDAPDRTASYAAFDMTVKDGKTRIYLYNGIGNDFAAKQGLFRLDDARVAHDDLFAAGANTNAWMDMTYPLVNPEDHQDAIICGAQCVYDLVVATPDGQPDTVYLGGQLNASLRAPVVASTNGGESFQSHRVDLQTPLNAPHVDVRSIVFNPENSDMAFVGSDGGVVRNNGRFGDGRYHCEETYGASPGTPFFEICQAGMQRIPEEWVFMNRGLAAMQLYNISADPRQPLKRIMAGTQDNSTQWHDGTESAKNWSKVFGLGDGTSANGFHRDNPDILFASFQSFFFFTNFTGAREDIDSWYFTAMPFFFSGELLDPVGPSGRQFITFDPTDADTQYTGFEHVWRTRNNGGALADLQAKNCNYRGQWSFDCGDWQPLGEFLTRDAYGPDRAGGVITAAERSSGDTGTLWAATTLGRVFVTKNVDDDHEAVDFKRLDSAETPPRFISGIAVDNENPDRAFISYSGFNAVTPDQPGHVFQVDYDGEGATFTSMDHNLQDLPINHIVRDDLTGDLYAATDYGVLVLRDGTTRWEQAGEGLPVVLTPHLEIHPEHRLLFAATHGLGGWYLNLPKLKRGK